MKLVKGTWDVTSRAGVKERVRPQDIKTTALFTVEGELDDISGSGQTKAAQTLCTGITPKNMQHLEVQGAGHYGIFSGRRWREVVYPAVKAFIQSHDQTLSKSVPVKTARKPSTPSTPKVVAKVSKPATKAIATKPSAKKQPSATTRAAAKKVASKTTKAQKT
jgi:poly(3-hydroxybutyrate) depolymerase